MKTKKKIIVGILGMACISIGVAGTLTALPVNKSFAQAEAVEMTLDTLGKLTWDKVNGATGYNWSYTVNDDTTVLTGGTSIDNFADVRSALKAAIADAKDNSLSQASVDFTVTPILASGTPEVQTWTTTFDEYINYDYTTTDISTYMEAEKITLPGYDKPFADVKFFKNDIFTFSLYADEEEDTSLYRIAFGGAGKGSNPTTNNYHFQFSANTNNDKIILKDPKNMSCGNVTLYAQTYYYYSLAVFDTYNLSGDSIGETVYLKACTYNEDANRLDEYFVSKNLFTTNEINEARTAGNYFDWNTDGDKIVISEYQNNKKTYISTGDISKALSLQAGFKVDMLGKFTWNEVDGAIGYRVSYPLQSGMQTVTVNTNEIDVREALQYAMQQTKALNTDTDTANDVTLASVPFTVTPIMSSGDGVALQYKHTFEQYLDYQDSYDIAQKWDVKEQNISGTRVDYYKNHLMSFGVRSDIMPLYQIAIGGAGGRNTSNYFILLYANGTASWRVQLADREYVQKYASKIAANENGYLSLGVFDTYDFMGEIIGETVYISQEAYDYSTDELKPITAMSWFFDKASIETKTTEGVYKGWTEMEIENEKTVEMTPISFSMNSSLSSPNTYIYSYDSVPSLATKDFTVYIVKGDEVLGTETAWKYGKPYDFSSYVAQADKMGYEIDHWIICYDGQTQEIDEAGVWEYDSTTGTFLIEAVYDPIDYNVTYDVPCGNPTTYNIESDFALAAPSSIPDGKVFDGWYEASDTTFSTPITSLKGKTGNLELVARFINGYTITVDGQDFDWREGDSAFALNATPVKGKTFQKWQVLSGSEFVDYTGETSFTPNADMTFRAVYVWNTYTITYVADGATHDNLASYTGENVVTLNKATKEGYFFLGWYKEATFETLVENTQAYAENLTLYAKFAEDKLPNELMLVASETVQTLPIPELPESAQYSVALYAGEEELTLTNNTFVFDKAGTYTVKYSITLPTGETIVREVALTVEQFYTVNVYYGDGEMITLQIKAGEKLTDADIPQPPEGVPFGGLYTDYKFTNAFDLNTAITQDTNIYVKWGEDAEKKSNLGWIIGGIAGGAVLIGAGVAVCFVIKKRKTGNTEQE